MGRHRHSKGLGGLAVAIIALLLLSLAAAYFLNSWQSLPAAGSGIKKFSSYEELQSYVRDSGDASGYYGGGIARQSSMDAAADSAPATAKAASESVSGGQEYSATNVQVQGVDESDIVKNDGKYIYAVSGSKVVIVDAYPAESAKNISELDFNGSVSGIFINGNRLVVFGQKYEAAPVPVPLKGEAEKMIARPIYPRYSPRTIVAIYDISDKSSPLPAGEIAIGGSYYDSRMVDKYVYVIANEPAYYAYAEEKNVTVPAVYYQGQAISRAFPDIYYFDGVPGNVFTTVAAINLDSPSDVASKVLLTNYAQNMFVSEKNIYIVYTKWASEADYLDQMIEIIKPLVPSDVRAKIDSVMALDVSKQTKMQAIGEMLSKYSATLSQSEREALESQAAEKMRALEEQIAREREKTVVQKISIDGGNIEYRTNAEVPGNTLNQFSMDEYNGYFRIATTNSGGGEFVAVSRVASPGVMTATAQKAIAVEEAQASSEASAATGNAVASETRTTPQNTGVGLSDTKKSEGITADEQKRISQTMPSQIPPAPPVQPTGPKNNVYVLDENLKIIGKLEDLAAGERIYSVRFLGDKAYMVTFRQVDPLFVIDLSVPENPNVLGYLKIPGVSDYLHPYDETHIIGVGRDATDEGRIKGLKIALFDVSDFANPREMSKYIIGEQGTSSDALYDHKAFLFSKEKGIIVIPVSEYHYAKAAAGEPWRSDYQPEYWQGAYVFNVDLANGITLKGKISHKNDMSSDVSKMRVEGKFGGALNFGGGTDADYYIKYPKIFSGKHNEITYEAWINPARYTNETAWIVGQRVHVGGAQILVNPGKVNWLVAGGSSDVHFGISSKSEIPLDEWTHVAGTFNGSVMRLYINGKEEAKLDEKFDVLWDGDYRGSFIGKDGSGWFSTFNGKIDNVRIYSRALSPDEVSAAYEGKEISSDGLVGWWMLDETSGAEAIDSSGKGNNGKLTDHKQQYYYDYLSQIRRSLYIDNILYTVSQRMVKMSALDSLNEINKVALPFEEQRYYGGIVY